MARELTRPRSMPRIASDRASLMPIALVSRRQTERRLGAVYPISASEFSSCQTMRELRSARPRSAREQHHQSHRRPVLARAVGASRHRAASRSAPPASSSDQCPQAARVAGRARARLPHRGERAPRQQEPERRHLSAAKKIWTSMSLVRRCASCGLSNTHVGEASASRRPIIRSCLHRNCAGPLHSRARMPARFDSRPTAPQGWRAA